MKDPNWQELNRFASTLVGRQFGSTSVLAARAEASYDLAGEPRSSIYLTLSRPHGDTWPLEDVLSLRRSVAGEAPLPFTVRLIPGLT